MTHKESAEGKGTAVPAEQVIRECDTGLEP
jgi:hypothetical protein